MYYFHTKYPEMINLFSRLERRVTPRRGTARATPCPGRSRPAPPPFAATRSRRTTLPATTSKVWPPPPTSPPTSTSRLRSPTSPTPSIQPPPSPPTAFPVWPPQAPICWSARRWRWPQQRLPPARTAALTGRCWMEAADMRTARLDLSLSTRCRSTMISPPPQQPPSGPRYSRTRKGEKRRQLFVKMYFSDKNK